MYVLGRTADTNEVRSYYVSRLAGPRVAGRRVAAGEELRMDEHEARGLLAAGEIVASPDRVDDPWGERAAEANAAPAGAPPPATPAAPRIDAPAVAEHPAGADHQPGADHPADPAPAY